MKYSEIVINNLILPKKDKYTIKDVSSVLCNSLFTNKTLSKIDACRIVLASAAFHDTDFSMSLARYKAKLSYSII